MSSFLTAHQHIIGYSVPWMVSRDVMLRLARFGLCRRLRVVGSRPSRRQVNSATRNNTRLVDESTPRRLVRCASVKCSRRQRRQIAEFWTVAVCVIHSASTTSWIHCRRLDSSRRVGDLAYRASCPRSYGDASSTRLELAVWSDLQDGPSQKSGPQSHDHNSAKY